MAASDEVDFFTGNRRELEIGNYHIQKTNGTEKRVKVNVRVPLSNRPMDGIPEWVSEGHRVVVKDRGFYRKAICDKVKLAGLAIDFYSTESVAAKQMTLLGCTVDTFNVERKGEDDKAQTYLNFVIYAPASQDISTWFYGMLGATTFAQFDSTQASFEYAGEDDENEEAEADVSHLPGADETDNPDSPAAQEKRRLDKFKVM